MKSRPTGITLIAVVMIILAVLSFLWSLLLFGVGGIGSFATTIFTFSPTLTGSFWSGVLGMISAVVQLATAVGLLRMSTWAWYLAMISLGLTLIEGFVGMFAGGIFTFLCGGIGILIPVVIFIYLLQPKIRALYGIGTTPS